MSPDELREILLKGVTEEVKSVVVHEVREVILHSQFMGPLPPPQALREYEKCCPGLADRIVGWVDRVQDRADLQQNHRQKLEGFVLQTEARNSGWGMACGFVLGLVGLLGSVYAMVNGAPTAGGLLGCGSLASLVGVFVYGSRERTANLSEKRRRLEPGNASKRDES